MDKKYKVTNISVANLYKIKDSNLKLIKDSIIVELSYKNLEQALYKELFTRMKIESYNQKYSKEDEYVVSNIRSIIPYCNGKELLNDKIKQSRLLEIYEQIKLENTYICDEPTNEDEKIKKIISIYSKLK